MKLTEKQKKFADYYIELGNATQAAIKAGYSKKTANRIGPENLSKLVIKKYIDERMELLASERIMSAQEILERLTKIAKADITETVIISGIDGMEEVEKPPDFKVQIQAMKELLKRYPGNDKILEQQLRKLTADATTSEAKAKILTNAADKLEGNFKNNELLQALIDVPVVEREEGDLS
ncbi:terminase small subunit [Lactococcus lactis]|uniref:terminase small subunit n=1 Tax=Lactococcus lactis TaxID=1358 RepID=UPI0018A8E20E|nr:terminase small subunit [Lactococcus lactis]